MNLHLNIAEHNVTLTQIRIDREFSSEEYKATKLVGDIIFVRVLALLGCVPGTEPIQLSRRVSIDENLHRPRQVDKRVGAARLNWVADNLNHVRKPLRLDEPDTLSDECSQGHVDNLFENSRSHNF